MTSPIIVWFHHDLRLQDNPALYAAAHQGPVIPVYCFDPRQHPPKSSAASWWLHHALNNLEHETHGNLCLKETSDTANELITLAQTTKARGIYWNASARPSLRAISDSLLKVSHTMGLIVKEHTEGTLLWHPATLRTRTGEPYKVFTPFYHASCKTYPPRIPLPIPPSLRWLSAHGCSLESLNLRTTPPWYRKLEPLWCITTAGAERNLNTFIQKGLTAYASKRDFPSPSPSPESYLQGDVITLEDKLTISQTLPSSFSTSLLSPYLACGLISPQQAWHAAISPIDFSANDIHRQRWHTELGWREFAHYQLFHFPDLAHRNVNNSFDSLIWRDNEHDEACWRRGLTGYPFVDAGMRQLWCTGFMHNRLRMITASFLVKNLLISWQHGANWFMRCLVDADEANNSAGWQWVAGCGADAAPYFRIFNPTLQGKKFDPEGFYTRHFIPELQNLPLAYLFEPWKAPLSVLTKAGITLGSTYPLPIVDLALSRCRALHALKKMKNFSSRETCS